LAIAGRDAKKEILDLVAKWLKEAHNRPWLLILDNADDFEVLLTKHGSSDSTTRLIDFIPDVSHGKVLVTSRDKSAAGFITGYQNLQQVTEMDNAESLQLVKMRLKTSSQVTDEEAKQLLESLDGIPLAITQACAYLNQNVLITIPRYIELKSQDGNNLLRRSWFDLRRDKDVPNAVIESLELSLRHIREHFPQAAELLSIISMFDRQKIPKFLIQSYRQTSGKVGLSQTPTDTSLVSAEISLMPTKISSSRLVRTRKTIKHWKIFRSRRKSPALESLYTHHEDSAEISGDNSSELPIGGPRVTRANGAHSNLRDIDEIATDEALSHLLNFSLIKVERNNMFEMHSIVQIAIKAWIRSENTSHWWQNIALNTIAEVSPNGNFENWTTWSILLPHVGTILADQQNDTSDNLNWLLFHSAWYLRKIGNYELSEKRAAWSLKISHGRLGERHPSTLTSMANLASTYQNQGRWNEAEKLQVQVMETRTRVLGKEHPDTLTSMANIASTYRDQGRWNEAEKLQVQVMEIRRRVLGEEHPSTLTSMTNLASTLWNQGRWNEAEKLEVQVMETSSRVLGKEHPSTLTSIANLVLTYQNQGRWNEAEKLEVQVMETSPRVLGEEHPDTLISIANLASTLWNQGRWNEAEKLNVQVMETSSRVLGEEHPNTLTSMANLAFIMKSQDRNEEAMILMGQCVNLRKMTLGIEHPDTESSIDILKEWHWPTTLISITNSSIKPVDIKKEDSNTVRDRLILVDT
jgi:tetratricopeptide (TPR) repeat protein